MAMLIMALRTVSKADRDRAENKTADPHGLFGR
jgi:hypothetical protein